jgi:Alpha/beta hydrolase family
MSQPVGGVCIRRHSENSDCIIFIHGILSSGETAWLNTNGSFWPALLSAEPAVKNAGIYVFSYRADLFSKMYSLKDVVDSLRDFFNLDRLWSARRICFVCHSMGGIVARKFTLVQQSKLIQNKTTVGFFLVASPSLGSRDANLLAPLARFFGNSQAEALRFSQNNVWLNELDSDFLTLKESGLLKICGKELVEDEAMLPKKLLGSFRQTVEPFAAARYFGEAIKIPFSDHSSIAKPADKDAAQYKELMYFLDILFGVPQSSEAKSASHESDRVQVTSPAPAQVVEASDNSELSQIEQDIEGHGSQIVRASGTAKIIGVTQKSKG